MAFMFKGVRYESSKKLTFAEVRAVEKYMGDPGRPRDINTFTAVETMMGEVYVTLKRLDPKSISWEQIENADMNADYEQIEDEQIASTEGEELIPDPLDDGVRTAESA